MNSSSQNFFFFFFLTFDLSASAYGVTGLQVCVPHPVYVVPGIKYEASCMQGMSYTNGAPAPAPGPALSRQEGVTQLHRSEPGPAVDSGSQQRCEGRAHRVRLECRLGPAAPSSNLSAVVPIATVRRRLVFTLPFISQGLGCGTGLCAHKVGKCWQSAWQQTPRCSGRSPKLTQQHMA